MASKANIMAGINAKAGNTKYSIWRIGLTHDLSERKTYWKDTAKKDVAHWSSWTADSLSDAQDIEAHFINKGMDGGVGGNLSARQATYVYAF
jgi:hypothetical protein